jgi:hypothetical protein
MGNVLTSNPIRVDTAATAFSTPKKIQLIQWVDDDAAAGGSIGDGEGLTMAVNGVTIQVLVVDISTQVPIAYEASFPNGVNIDSLVVSVIDGGTLLIWQV